MSDPRNAARDWVDLQAAIANPPKDGTAQYGKYATLDGILAYVRPLLATHGFGIQQALVNADAPDMVGVVTDIRHISGEMFRFGPFYLPAGPNAQTAGSAATYGRRYQLCAALGIAAENDDDGKSASRGGATAPSTAKAQGSRSAVATERRDDGSTAPPTDAPAAILGEGAAGASPTPEMWTLAESHGLTKAKAVKTLHDKGVTSWQQITREQLGELLGVHGA
jgi:hypothetical protein